MSDWQPPRVGQLVHLALPTVGGGGTTDCHIAEVISVNAYPEDIIIHVTCQGHMWQHVMCRREFGAWECCPVEKFAPGTWHYPEEPGIHREPS